MTQCLALQRLYAEATRKAAETQPQPQEGRHYTPVQLQCFEKVFDRYQWAVCLIKTQKDPQPVFGTGFLIGGQLLMTNYHVIPDEETAQKSEAIFFRVTAQNIDEKHETFDRRRISLKESKIICQSRNRIENDIAQPADDEHLDYTILILAPQPYLERVQDKVFNIFHGVLPQIKTPACVIHHPTIINPVSWTDRDLRLSLGLFQKQEDCSIMYDTETTPGSSGGAVINEKGQLVALHHQGLGKQDLDPQRPYCNAGVLITAIVKSIGKDKRIEIEGLILSTKKSILLLRRSLPKL